MATMTAFLVVPGLLVGLAARLSPRQALAAAPPVTYGVIAIASYAYGHLGVRWSVGSFALATAFVVLLVAAVSATVARRRRPADRTPPPDAPRGRRWVPPRPRLGRPGRSWLPRPTWTWLVGPAVLVSAWVVGQGVITELSATVGGTANVFQGWDAHWHANYIRYIHDVGQAAPDLAGTLRYPENANSLYYPSTWHAFAALVMSATGASAVETYNLVQIGTLSLGFPLGVAALTWAVLRLRCSPATTATAAAAAAVATPLFPGLPYVELMVAATPSAAANALAGLVFALIMAALTRRRFLAVAALGLVGVGGVHPSALVTTVVLLVFWWLFDGLWRPVRTRLRDVAALAAIGVVGAASLVPQLLSVSSEAESISAFEFQIDADRAATWGKAVALQVRHVDYFGIRWVLLSLALVGALFLLRRGLVWPVLLWGALVVLCVNTLSAFGNWTGGWLRAVGSVYYNDPRRVGVVLAVVVAVAVGVGVGAVAQGLAGLMGRLMDPITDPLARGVVPARVAVALAAAVAVASWNVQTTPEYAVYAGGDQRWGRLVDSTDLRAFRWLSQQPKAYAGQIYTNPDEGSGWMYATDGLPSTARHYLRADPATLSPLTSSLFEGLDEAGVDPDVDEALAELGITYVYISPPNYWWHQKANPHVLELDDTPGLVKVYADMQVRIFAVRAAFTPDELRQILRSSPFPADLRPAMTRGSLVYGAE